MLSFFKKISQDIRAFPVGIRLIVLTLFLRSFGWGFVDPFLSIFVSGFTHDYTQVGSLISIINLTFLLATIPLIGLADKIKDTVIMRDGEVVYFFAIAFYLLAAFTGKVSFLIFAFIFNGIAIPFVIVGAETYIRKCGAEASETSSFAFYTAFDNLGWILGMFIAAFTVQYYGLKLMFLFILPGIFFGSLVLRRIQEEGITSMFTGFKKYFHNRDDLRLLAQDIKNFDHKTFLPLLFSFFDGVIVMFSFVFIPLFARSLNFGLGSIALLMALMYTPFIFSFFISELTNKFNRMHVIAMGLFIGGISFIFLSFIVQQLWMALLVIMQSIAIAIIRPAYNEMLTHLAPRKNLGEVTGLNNIAMRSGYVVGPIFTGFIADMYSMQTAFFVVAILAFLLAAFTLSFKGYEPLKTEILT